MPDDIATLLLDRLGDQHPGLRTRTRDWTWDQVVRESAARGALAIDLRRKHFPDKPPHIGVLLDNVEDFVFWLGGAALAGAVIVGINPTRGPADMAADIRHADCQLIVTDAARLDLALALDHGLDPAAILCIDDPAYAAALDRHREQPAAAPGVGPRSCCCCCSPRAPRGPPKQSGAPRAGWRGSPTPRRGSSATSATTSNTVVCHCFTATRSWRCGPRPCRWAPQCA